ncbi:MAG: 2-C-methyl-D-erythritol 2,4-cyclodiphosphate synthase [Acidobacteria bacterium]|nr:2-C-methyl-D-erythritol 2,4-cyclodiphosphate synthase [Acidobacteriota bacterium]
MRYRIGQGSDVHRLIEGRPLIIGGVEIESDLGADGHSDADVLLHAVTDAVLGALALGDIGSHFPNSDPRWKDASSSAFLSHAVSLAQEKGYTAANLDCTVHLESPKLRPHIDAMRANLARILKIDIAAISVKAKTGEAVDAVGTSKALRADAVILFEKAP